MLVRTGVCTVLAASLLAGAFSVGARAGDLPTPSLNTVIERYFVWRGGEAYEHLKSVHDVGYSDLHGVHQSFERWEDHIGRVRANEDFGAYTRSQGETQYDSWVTNLSGQVLAEPGASRDLRRIAMIEFGDAFRGRNGATAVLQQILVIGNQSVAIVRVTFGDAVTYDVYINADSGALIGYRVSEGGVQTAFNLADWRMVDGVRMPFARSTRSTNGQQSSVKYTSVTVNPAVEPTLFMRPSPVRKSAFRGGGTSSGWIPFDLYAGRLILFPAEVNGHSVTAVLDSGATSSVVDAAFAASIGLIAATNGQQVAGLHGTEQAGFIPKVSVNAGDLTLNDLTVVSMDLTPMSKVTERPILFYFGDEAFDELVVDIDFAGRRLRFLDPRSVQAPPHANQAPLLPISSGRAALVRVEGGAAVPVSFDLGDSSALEVYSIYSGPTKLLQGRQASAWWGVAVGGAKPDVIATLREVDFGDVKFANVPATFADAGAAGEPTALAGRIGIGLLSRFRVLVDFPQNQLYLVPAADAATRPFDKDRLGLSMERDGEAFKVVFVAPGSPAAAAGFVAGDRVVKINGRAAGAWSFEQRQALEQAPAGTRVEITLGATTARSVVLADYY